MNIDNNMNKTVNENDIKKNVVDNTSLISNCSLICESIGEFINVNSYNTKYLSVLSKAVLLNDITHVKELLKGDNSIYSLNMLCSGMYFNKFQFHPSECHDVVCKKTSMYYALWLNTLIYSRIFIEIINLLNNSPCLHFRSQEFKENNTDTTDLDDISFSLESIYTKIIKLNDSLEVINQYNILYDNESMYFNKVYNIFDELPTLLVLLDKRYGINNNQLKFTDLTNKLINPVNKMMSWRKSLGNIYRYENTNKVIDHNKQVEVISNINNLYKEYKKSTDIVKLLFNQQAYEYFKYNLVHRPYNINKTITQIKVNPCVNIEYVYPNDNNNILSFALKYNDTKDLVSTLFELSKILPVNFSVMDIVNKGFIGNTKELIRNCNSSYLSDPLDLFNKIIKLKTRSSDTLELVSILIGRGVVDNVDGIIDMCINHRLSLDMLKILANRENIMKTITLDNLVKCIELKKHMELGLLIDNRKILLKNKTYDDYLLNIYLQKTNNDTQSNVLTTLDTLLSKQINLETVDSMDRTILINTILEDRASSVERLLEAGSDPFHTDTNGLNSLHYAIIHQKFKIIKMLALKMNKSGTMLVNEPNSSQEYPIHLAIKTHEPIKTIDHLASGGRLNYNINDINGDNVLHYIIGQKRIPIWIKTKLFRALINKITVLTANSNVDKKPLVIRSVENDYYDIVILLMNNLLQSEEIFIKDMTFNETNITIEKLITKFKISNQLVPKNSNEPNFYPLVIKYIKDNIHSKNYSSKNLINLTNFLMILLILVVIVRTLHYFNYMRHYYIMDQAGLFDDSNHSAIKNISNERL